MFSFPAPLSLFCWLSAIHLWRSGRGIVIRTMPCHTKIPAPGILFHGAGARGPLLLLVLLLLQIQLSTGQPFDGCDETAYYQGPYVTPPSRTELHELLERTHRRPLPYTDKDGDDVWKALLDIDAGPANDDSTQDTVLLIYKQTLLHNASAMRGVPGGGWNREHVWPKSRGVGDGGADFTDVHHLRPSDWNVNAARGNKFLGTCPVDVPAQCTVPAHVEAATDTAASTTTFLPPAAARGVVARALLYMSVRYHPLLRLTDCPSSNNNNNNEMAYLSELLTWHETYPVSDAERQRNQRICERWQGNRNPFVDHPEWVKDLFGAAQQTLPYNCESTTTTTTSAPTGSSVPIVTTNSSCPTPGSIMMVGANTDNPDAVAMVALTDLRAGLQLYLTDNGWTAVSNEFRTNEGVLTAVLSQDVGAGTVFGLGISTTTMMWESQSGSFALAAAGDTLLLYCIDGDDGDDDDNKIHHITGLSLAGPWDDTATGTDQSALPAALKGIAAVALEHVDNAKYVGPTVGTADFLRSEILQPANWQGSNSETFDLAAGWTFQVTSDAAAIANSASLPLSLGIILVLLHVGLR